MDAVEQITVKLEKIASTYKVRTPRGSITNIVSSGKGDNIFLMYVNQEDPGFYVGNMRYTRVHLELGETGYGIKRNGEVWPIESVIPNLLITLESVVKHLI